MTLTLFEAIRELKPGQEIHAMTDQGRSYPVLRWSHGDKGLTYLVGSVDLQYIVYIIDLPKPQPTLYDVLVAGIPTSVLRRRCYECDESACSNELCNKQIVDTLQDIALKAGFDLKQITAGENGA